jgi:hypothetical protein
LIRTHYTDKQSSSALKILPSNNLRSELHLSKI